MNFKIYKLRDDGENEEWIELGRELGRCKLVLGGRILALLWLRLAEDTPHVRVYAFNLGDRSLRVLNNVKGTNPRPIWIVPTFS